MGHKRLEYLLERMGHMARALQTVAVELHECGLPQYLIVGAAAEEMRALVYEVLEPTPVEPMPTRPPAHKRRRLTAQDLSLVPSGRDES